MYTVLDGGKKMEDESKIPIGSRKCIFLQSSINVQRPKLRVHINFIVIWGLLNMGAHATIIISEFWHSNCLLQESDVQFLGIKTLS